MLATDASRRACTPNSCSGTSHFQLRSPILDGCRSQNTYDRPISAEVTESQGLGMVDMAPVYRGLPMPSVVSHASPGTTRAYQSLLDCLSPKPLETAAGALRQAARSTRDNESGVTDMTMPGKLWSRPERHRSEIKAIPAVMQCSFNETRTAME
ncbi:hypothetical protein BO71DRAFT_481563 [Aspergillus ellipticus CBS 707.79]|uniref:Uncharacterized protein n=1 Tax=Aspergillus ellipticus CBS 707.79 TaxID=1448320 RepID=A0A319DSS8_9EURO|nr:hypothetical protein BO71DRAFT_481563 [Aspergillus ellipticus CBS 707.79]